MGNNDVVGLGFSLVMLLDRTEAEATKLAEANGLEVRVTWRDGQTIVTTDDLQPKRVNLNIVNGIVSSYEMG